MGSARNIITILFAQTPFIFLHKLKVYNSKHTVYENTIFQERRFSVSSVSFTQNGYFFLNSYFGPKLKTQFDSASKFVKGIRNNVHLEMDGTGNNTFCIVTPQIWLNILNHCLISNPNHVINQTIMGQYFDILYWVRDRYDVPCLRPYVGNTLLTDALQSRLSMISGSRTFRSYHSPSAQHLILLSLRTSRKTSELNLLPQIFFGSDLFQN